MCSRKPRTTRYLPEVPPPNATKDRFSGKAIRFADIKITSDDTITKKLAQNYIKDILQMDLGHYYPTNCPITPQPQYASLTTRHHKLH